MSDVTIVARLTPAGGAALSTFAVMGPKAKDIVEALLERGRAGALDSNRPIYGWFGAEMKDDVVVSVDDGISQPCIEISCHGGVAMTERLIAAVVAKGAVEVDWRTLELRRGRTEFQCDALESLASAPTARVAAILLDQLNGALNQVVREAATHPSIAAESLRYTGVGRLLERPAKVVLFGLPNAGKSTLFNAIAGYSRIITNAVAGTTRDVVRETIAIDGWPVELVDGAGFRGDATPLEEEGMRRLEAVLETADVKILVVDSSHEENGNAMLAKRFQPTLIVGNKADLKAGGMSFASALSCSAMTGAGVAELKSAIAGLLAPQIPPIGAAVPFRESHRRAFEEIVRRSGVASACSR